MRTAAMLAPGLLLAVALTTAHAQVSGEKPAQAPRAQIKMERDEFLKSHRWDEPSSTWVMRDGFDAPAGVKARSEVKAERDAFLSKNRWDPVTAQWTPIKAGPRDVTTMSRAEIKAETQRFLRTHRWDESGSTWVEKPVRTKSR